MCKVDAIESTRNIDLQNDVGNKALNLELNFVGKVISKLFNMKRLNLRFSRWKLWTISDLPFRIELRSVADHCFNDSTEIGDLQTSKY